MGSLIEELRRREAAARAEADRLRSRMEELAQELARAGEQASRLAVAREEVVRVLEQPASAELPGGPAKEPRPDSPVGKFLERRGEGIHHVGYGVTDVRAAIAAIGAGGVRLIDERPRHGSMGASIAFLHPADVGGVLTELVEHPEEHAEL